MDLLDTRTEIADRIFDDFDFVGEEIVDADGWESVVPGTEMSRKIYLDNGSEPSLPGHLTIVFADGDSSIPVEAYAMMNGDLIGSMTAAQLGRYAVPETSNVPAR